MSNFLIKFLQINIILLSFVPLFSQADDTEIYLGSAVDRSKSLPNIIFIMDTSGSMSHSTGDNQTRLASVKEAATAVISEAAAESVSDPTKNFNIALMSFNSSNQGASVDMPMTPVIDAEAAFTSIMNDYAASGGTPITESLDEALRYLKGDTPLYGTNSVASSKQNGHYKSPIANECQTNHIVLFSDGEPTADEASNSDILNNFNNLTGTRKDTLIADVDVPQCSPTTGTRYTTYTTNSFYSPDLNPDLVLPVVDDNGITYFYSHTDTTFFNNRYYYYYYERSGTCAEELALLGQLTDLAPSASIPGIQGATFHTVGGFAGGAALSKLKNIALYGTPLEEDETTGLLTEPYRADADGNLVPKNYYAANSTAELKIQLSKIFDGAIETDSTFTAPAISVNSYNRLQHNEELYYSVFSPEQNTDWKGNLKRYLLGDGGVILDSRDVAAVDPNTGFFSHTSQSVWSANVDGAAVDKGGIASRFQLPTAVDSASNGRIVTSFLSGTTLTNENNRIHPDNKNIITNDMLGLPAETSADKREIILAWAAGIDVSNENAAGGVDLSNPTPRLFMEDPLHSQPLIINYALDTVNRTTDSTIFLSTNSGYLHAFSPDEQNPKELFSFIPKELLKNIPKYYDGESGKAYGLDGPMSYYHHDLNANGSLLNAAGGIESSTVGSTNVSEYIHLYASMRRGGRHYYALDVSDRSTPKFLWQINGGEGHFDKLGQSWSKMIPAVVKWNNEETKVLFFAGGYDANSEDCLPLSSDTFNCNTGPATRPTVTMGNAIFMVNAETGEYLWSASNSDAELILTGMTSSIVSDLVILDTNQDGLTDLIYSSDTGGRIWRIDLDNTSSNMSATGGLIADMNRGGTNNIRFYNKIDLAYMYDQNSGISPRFQLSIGSGYRAHPLDIRGTNRFYMINDFNVTEKPTVDTLSSFYQTVYESDLSDFSADAPTVIDPEPKGEYIILPGVGEKVLSRSITASGVVFFSTYRPNDGSATVNCTPNVGLARLYRYDSSYDGSDGSDGSDGTNPPVDLPPDSRCLDSGCQLVEIPLDQTGISPEPVLLFPPEPSCTGSGCSPCEDSKPVIAVGAEIVGSGLNNCGLIKKTYWKVN